MPIKTTALIQVRSTQERGKKPVIEITLPERLTRLIRSTRAGEMRLNLGPDESIRISADAFRRVIEETYRGGRHC
jgi:hypothetical protein